MTTSSPSPTHTNTRWQRIRQNAEKPVDIASLVLFRIAFGLLMCVAMLRFFWYGWIDALYVQPRFFFTYYGFSWVTPLSPLGMKLLFACAALFALAIAAGAWTRISTLLFLLAFGYIELLDKTNYLNHYYLVSILAFLMLWMPVGNACSVDAWRRPNCAQKTAPNWCIWCLRLQLGLVYFFAGLAKLTPDWLLHAQPLTTWLGAKTDFPILGPLFGQGWFAQIMSIAGATFDLCVAFCLLHKMTRPVAYLAVVGFHVFTGLLFPIGMFPWLMIGSTLIFFSPSWPRRWLPASWLPSPPLAEIQQEGATSHPKEPPVSALGLTEQQASATSSKEQEEPVSHPKEQEAPALHNTWKARLLVGGLGIFFVLQLAIPLRGHLYPGDVHWHEQGYRFSWRVMLMEKNGYVDFVVTDPKSRKRWVFSGSEELTPLQAKMMSTQPDMLLAYAHHLAEKFRKRGYPAVEVRVRSQVSLNGRPRQPIVDPRVDLAKQPRGYRHKPWILPQQSKK